MEIENTKDNKRKVLFEKGNTKEKVYFIGVKSVNIIDIFRAMGKNDEEIKEEIRHLEED